MPELTEREGRIEISSPLPTGTRMLVFSSELQLIPRLGRIPMAFSYQGSVVDRGAPTSTRRVEALDTP
jgi:hypothetical protein